MPPIPPIPPNGNPAPNISDKSGNPWEKSGASPSQTPNWSYCCLFWESDKIPYASVISLNFVSASSLLFGFLSGCLEMESFLNAFLI